jgi:hypothetical protein
VKYLLIISNDAVVPERLALNIVAAGLKEKCLPPEKNALSMTVNSLALGCAKYTGDPKINPSHVFAFSTNSLTKSLKMQCPISLHFRQPMQSGIG